MLLVITVWGLEPIVGARRGQRPAGGDARGTARREGSAPWQAVAGGVLLLAAGLLALALLPRVSNLLVAVALAFCGLGIGLAVPVLTRVALHQDTGLVRSGAITVSARHAGLVLALALVAPLLTSSLDDAGQRALLGGTKAILDANVPLQKKVPIALSLRDALAVGARRVRCPTCASRSMTRAPGRTMTSGTRVTRSSPRWSRR